MHLSVHLSETWSQGSDHGKLLIEKDALSNLDCNELNFNRHILLRFPVKFLEKVVGLQIDLNEYPMKESTLINEYSRELTSISIVEI